MPVCPWILHLIPASYRFCIEWLLQFGNTTSSINMYKGIIVNNIAWLLSSLCASSISLLSNISLCVKIWLGRMKSSKRKSWSIAFYRCLEPSPIISCIGRHPSLYHRLRKGAVSDSATAHPWLASSSARISAEAGALVEILISLPYDHEADVRVLNIVHTHNHQQWSQYCQEGLNGGRAKAQVLTD